MELGPAQVALELQQRGPYPRLAEPVLLRPQPPGHGHRRVGLPGPQPALPAQQGVEPRLDLLGLLEGGVVAVRRGEGAVDGVGSGVVVAQVPERVGVQSVGVGVVGGGAPPPVARRPAEHAAVEGTPPTSSVSVHPTDARGTRVHTGTY